VSTTIDPSSNKEDFFMQFKCNEKINQVTENTLVVGMDIAKRVHYACFVDERGRVIEKAFAVHQLKRRL
jgi:transposase